jgi:TolB-like protein/TPR repeat protein
VAENNVLDSWKAISDYLGKRVRTCIRWEKDLGLPVHRIDSLSTRSRVFAYKSEIDQWRRQKADVRSFRRMPFLSGKVAIAGAIFLVIGLFLIFIVRPFAADSTGRAAAAGSLRPVKIAVLPFSDGSGAAYEEYLSVGLAQEIVDCLRRHKGLAVISLPTLVRNMPLSKAEHIGRELGLDYILKGKIRREKDCANLDLEFIRAANEELMWSSKYREPLNQLWAIKNDLSAKIGEVLHPGETSPLPLQGRPEDRTNNLVWDSYFKGNFILSRLNGETKDPWTLYYQGKYHESKYTVGDNELAINLFRQAIGSDQNFASAYVGLATCYANYVHFNWDYNILWLDRAEELLAKALALNHDLPGYFSTQLEILLLREYSFGQNREAQIESLAQTGPKRYPHDPQINSIVGTYHFRRFGKEGRPEDWAQALRYKEKSFLLNPYALSNIVYVEILLLNRDFDTALEVCSLLEKLDISSLAKFQLGEVYYYRGDLDKSESIFEGFQVPMTFRLTALYYLGMIHAQRGEQKEALQAVQEINLLSPGEFRFFDDRLKLASIFMGLGREESGYQYLQSFFQMDRAIRDRFINYRYIALDKNFDKIRNDNKFLDLLNQKEASPWVRARPSG